MTHRLRAIKRVAAQEAKNRFGKLGAQGQREPVRGDKAGQIDTVVLAAEHDHALAANQDKADWAARKRRFESAFAAWVADQNARAEALGVPGADLRPW